MWFVSESTIHLLYKNNSKKKYIDVVYIILYSYIGDELISSWNTVNVKSCSSFINCATSIAYIVTLLRSYIILHIRTNDLINYVELQCLCITAVLHKTVYKTCYKIFYNWCIWHVLWNIKYYILLVQTPIHIIYILYIMLMQHVFIGHLWSRRKTIIILSIASNLEQQLLPVVHKICNS